MCHVANYQSLLPSPRKYTYRGCSTLKPNRLPCGKSIENNSDVCGHKAERTGKWQHFFRFQLLLFDADSVNPPLYATIFHCAQKLLDIGRNEFAELDDAQQEAMLAAITFQAPLINAWFKPNRHGMPILQKLDKIVVLEDADDAATYHTPVKDFRNLHSPTKATGSSAGPSSSSARGGTVTLGDVEASNLQRSLLESLSLLSLHVGTPKK